MGSLQEQLLKAGLISAEQLEQSRTKKSPGPGGRGRHGGAKGGRNDARADSRGADSRGRRQDGAKRSGKPAGRSGKPAGAKKTADELSLEAAYRARQQLERTEEQQTKQRQQREQEARRQRNLKLDEIVKDQIRNHPDADIRRYFEYGDRIRHLYVTAEQLQQLADGELGIVVLRGRYLLLEAAVMKLFAAEAPDLVPDLTKETVAPEVAEAVPSELPDVPDDLRW